MNLYETIQALSNIRSEQYPNGITVALDIGVHQYCDVDSNCPVAIELRRMVTEAGVGLQELLEGYSRAQETLDDVPEFSLENIAYGGSIAINVAGQSIEVDLSDQIREQLEYHGQNILDRLDHNSRQLTDYGTSFYHTCMSAIARARATKTLPQLQLEFTDLIKYKPLITTEENNYLLSFPIRYKPEWLYSRNIRYAMAQRDIREIEQDVFVVFPITQDKKILRPYLVDTQGRKFSHYHGRAGDCWGSVELPEHWDDSLGYLADVAYQLQASLATINLDSLMQSQPSGMPDTRDLRDRATVLGEEGVAREQPSQSYSEYTISVDPGVGEPVVGMTPRRGWGRTGGTNA